MIARNAKNREAEWLDELAKPIVGGAAVVLDKIARHRHQVGRPVRIGNMLEHT